LTAVGKVYRPKLRCEAIRHLIERELEDVIRAGTAITVSVAHCPSGKISATIALNRSEEERQSLSKIIDDRLSLYAFTYTII
jgi:hypothetical protein